LKEDPRLKDPRRKTNSDADTAPRSAMQYEFYGFLFLPRMMGGLWILIDRDFGS